MGALRRAVGSCARAVGRLPLLRTLVYHRAVRGTLQHWPGFRQFYGGGWELEHPFDRRHGTDTSGYVPTCELPSSPDESGGLIIYAGSQPSIIRAALNTLPPLPDCCFLDLGCGKGRPLLVASEYAFKDLIGVELSATLASDARRNADILRRNHPQRTPIRIEHGDAAQFPLPPGSVVVFLYNPFGDDIIAKLVSRIEQAVAAGGSTLFVVYYNPVHGQRLDASASLARYFAANLAYAAEELGYGPDIADTVVIWQAGGASTPHPGADAPIRVVQAGVRAELA